MQDDTAYGISFISLPGMEAIEVIDPIERYRYRLETPEDVMPESIATDDFLFPVDRAISIESSAIELPIITASCVRTTDGRSIVDVEHDMNHSLPEDSYVIELSSQIKLYLELISSIRIRSDHETISFDFGNETQLNIGARSAHKRPEATVRTTTSAQDIMRAVSTFGTALKTMSPERSFPTLRGHPPRIEVGSEAEIPDELTPPDNGIKFVLEPKIETVFTTAPLVYYLGGTIESGERNLLLVDGEIERELGTGETFSTSIEEILKHNFLLDCVVRTEGLYPINLDERSRLEKRVALDFAELYHLPLADRLRRYLTVPYKVTEDLVPMWGIAAHMEPNPHHAELLPYVVDDLALINVHDSTAIDRPESPVGIVEATPGEATAFIRSGATSAMETNEFVRPPTSDCVDQVWIGEGTPIGANKAIPEAFEHRLERTPTDARIDITVVCNDERMNEERGLIDEIYGSREDVTFEISIHQDLTCDELIDVMTNETDFLHYIGHIDDDGFWCEDGKLDLANIEDVGVSSFFLNACQSYRQGRHIIEYGGIGGIVTLSDVINDDAVRLGHTLAKLLNMGFPLYAALGIARQDSPMGGRYIVIGDGRVELTQPKSIPQLCKISSSKPIDFTYATFPTKSIDTGSLTFPILGDSAQYFLISNEIDTIEPTQAEVEEFLGIENIPVYLDGELTWSEEIVSL